MLSTEGILTVKYIWTGYFWAPFRFSIPVKEKDPNVLQEGLYKHSLGLSPILSHHGIHHQMLTTFEVKQKWRVRVYHRDHHRSVGLHNL